MSDEHEIEKNQVPHSTSLLIKLPVYGRLNWIAPREMCRLFSTQIYLL